MISGTGWADEALTKFSAGTNLLLHEAVHIPTLDEAEQMGLEATPDQLTRELALHTSIEGVGRMAAQADVDLLVLVRLRPPPLFDIKLTSAVRAFFEGAVVIASDGDTFTP